MQLKVHAIRSIIFELLSFSLENVFFQKVFLIIVKDSWYWCIEQGTHKQQIEQVVTLIVDNIECCLSVKVWFDCHRFGWNTENEWNRRETETDKKVLPYDWLILTN
jgi:hypothetical protein